MSREHHLVPCEGETLVATLDRTDGDAGLLIVSGGNEPRNGAYAGQSRLAARIAARGYPVLRFDRRGVGDSTGTNAGFRASAADIEAAIACLRRECPQLRRVVGFGNCDAASALLLGAGFGLEALVLCNPWTFDDDASQDILPEDVKARYWAKLRNPREIARLIGGQVSIKGVARSIGRAATGKHRASELGAHLDEAIAAFDGEVRILLAGRDRTARVFRANCPEAAVQASLREQADHALTDPADHRWLEDQIAAVLEGEI